MDQPKFKDAKGREWFPRLDYARLRMIRDKAGVDLGNVERMGQTWAELISDDLKCLSVIWLTVAHETISEDDWLGAMDGELLELAREALGEAVVNFTQPLKRGMLKEGMEAVQTKYREAVAIAEQQVREVIQGGLERVRGALPPSVQESLDTLTSSGT